MNRYLLVWLAILGSLGATYQSDNFEVSAPTPEIASDVSHMAELHWDAINCTWFGGRMADLRPRCKITVETEKLPPLMKITETGDEKKHMYIDAKTVLLIGPYCFRAEMQIFCHESEFKSIRVYGNRFNSTLAHELAHVGACNYRRQQLPLWLREGMAIIAESSAHQDGWYALMYQDFRAGRHLPVSRLFETKEYLDVIDPAGFYAQAYAVTDWLVHEHPEGHRRLLDLTYKKSDQSWDEIIREVYEYDSVEELEDAWQRWMEQESATVTLASLSI